LHHTGIDFSNAYQGMSAWDRLERRSRNITQELIGSADAINRFNSLQMFYRVARDHLGLKDEEAFRWAGDRVAETQGQFTAFNRIGLMRNPNMRAVLQFKSFPLILMKTVTKAMYNSLRKGASGEERWMAIKTLGGLMASSMALSGVRGAVPEPIEDLNNILSIFGLTDSWDQYEDKLQSIAADEMGSTGANLLMGGLGDAIGVDLTHRGGISNLTGLARLHTAKPEDMQQTVFKYMAGVPGSIAGDAMEGVGELTSGNYTDALKLFLPRIISDPIKAYQEYNQGVTTQAGAVITKPVGVPDAIRKMLGFTTSTESHAREARYLTGEEEHKAQDQRSKVEKAYTQGNRSDALRAMQRYNRDHPDDPITMRDLTAAAKRAQKPKILGYQVTKKRQQELERRQQEYGLQ
jgi:hypothetical protein